MIGEPVVSHGDAAHRGPAGDIEDGFRMLADAMPQLVWTATSDGSVDYYNRRVEDYGGWTVDGATYDWQPLVHADDLAATAEAWAAAVARAEVYEFEHRILMVDGTYRWHLSRAVPVPTGRNDEMMWFGTATDVHRRKLAEQHSAEVAHLLQRALLPRPLPTSDRFVLAGGYRPADRDEEVGGDWYDAFEVDGRLTVVVGDAAGHDVAAAATMGAARHAVATAVVTGAAPTRILTVANEYLCLLDDVFVTCTVVQVDLTDGSATVASAGHLPPVVREVDGTATSIAVTPSPPLGVAWSSPITSSSLRLDETDALLLYTDGLIERRGLTLDASLQRLCQVVSTCPGDTAHALAAHLMQNYDRHDDDVALLVVRLTSS